MDRIYGGDRQRRHLRDLASADSTIVYLVSSSDALQHSAR